MSSSRQHFQPQDLDEHDFELTEDGRLPSSFNYRLHTAKYDDGRSIDWLLEETAERERISAKKSSRGVGGLVSIWTESIKMWMVVVATGAGIGLAGAWLDVLVKWCPFPSCITLTLANVLNSGLETCAKDAVHMVSSITKLLAAVVLIVCTEHPPMLHGAHTYYSRGTLHRMEDLERILSPTIHFGRVTSSVLGLRRFGRS
jgi:hypothetical protein